LLPIAASAINTGDHSGAAAGNGRDKHYFVAVLKGVSISAKEAEILVVDVDIDELPQLSAFILDLAGESWKSVIKLGEQSGQVRRGGVELFLTVGVAGKCSGNHNFDGHWNDSW
jgi:hypothetical protein